MPPAENSGRATVYRPVHAVSGGCVRPPPLIILYGTARSYMAILWSDRVAIVYSGSSAMLNHRGVTNRSLAGSTTGETGTADAVTTSSDVSMVDLHYAGPWYIKTGSEILVCLGNLHRGG